MNLEKFTDRAKGFLQSAQTVAIRVNHQRIAPEHLLKALLEDNEGMCAGLIKASGGDAAAAVRETDAALAKIPAVSGSGANQAPGLDNDLVRVLDQAEQILGRNQRQRRRRPVRRGPARHAGAAAALRRQLARCQEHRQAARAAGFKRVAGCLYRGSPETGGCQHQ